MDWGAEPAMSDMEALMWRSEASPRLRSGGVILDMLDSTPDWARLVAAHEWAVTRVPRPRERVIEDPLRLAPPAWADADDFDLAYHLRRMRVHEGSGMDAVLDTAQVLAMAPFDKARPLWEAVLIEGLPDGRSAYALKLHHSLLDGAAVIQLFDILHSDRPDPTPAKSAATREPHRAPHPAGRLVRQLSGVPGRLGGVAAFSRDLVLRPEPTIGSGVRFARSLARLAGPPPAAPSPLMAERSLARRLAVIDLPLAWLRAAGKEAGGAVNGAFPASPPGG